MILWAIAAGRSLDLPDGLLLERGQGYWELCCYRDANVVGEGGRGREVSGWMRFLLVSDVLENGGEGRGRVDQVSGVTVKAGR